jgi:hypothetical protein
MIIYIAGQIAEVGKPELEKYVYRGGETGYNIQLNYFKIGIFI